MPMSRYDRSLMECACRNRQEQQRSELGVQWKEYLVSLAVARLDAEWGAPETQADMLVLAKYHKASFVKGANIRVQGAKFEHGGLYYRDVFGVEFTSDLLTSRETPYLDFGIDRGDPEWPRLRGMVLTRHTYEADQRREYDDFRKAIRSTSSKRKITEMFPWLASVA